MNGGKKSVLTQDFVFMLFTMITYSAFTEQPMKKKDVCAVILAHLQSVNAEYAVTKWEKMDPEKRPFAPSRVNYDLFGVTRISRAFRKDQLVHDEPLRNVPGEIRTACAELFQLNRKRKMGAGYVRQRAQKSFAWRKLLR
jgi:hypothetical protein